MTALFKFDYFNIVRKLLTCGFACCRLCFISGYKDLPVAPVAPVATMSRRCRRWIVSHTAFMTVGYYNVHVLPFQSNARFVAL